MSRYRSEGYIFFIFRIMFMTLGKSLRVVNIERRR
jgi:hypothetical protein